MQFSELSSVCTARLSLPAETPLSIQLQEHRRQHEACVCSIENIRCRSYAVHYQPGIIIDMGLIQHHSHHRQRDAQECEHDIAPVSVVESVYGKRRAAFQRVAAAFHGLCAFHDTLHEPGDEHGNHSHAVRCAFPQCSLPAPSSYTGLSAIHPAGLLRKSRQAPQMRRHSCIR